MAKKIRFPLEMDNGVEVRSVEELRDNFSLVKVLTYFENGRLIIWLRDRYANDIADALEILDKTEEKLAKKICEIFDVPYDEKAAERAERLKQLKKFTNDEKFLNAIDNVAFDQDELYDLLDEEEEIIYLCGDKFSIPLAKPRVSYIGINNPIAVIDSKFEVDWDEKKILIEGVEFDEEYQKVIDNNNCKKAGQENNASSYISEVGLNIGKVFLTVLRNLSNLAFEKKVIGHAEIRQIFKVSGVGVIAGSYVLDGKILEYSKARIYRNEELIFDGRLASLRRFKDEVKEVNAGYECGLIFEEFKDIKEGDQVEIYILEVVDKR